MSDHGTQQADLIFHGGDILTINDANPTAEAIAVKDGIIIAVGSAAEINSLRGENTLSVDLKGATLMPGLIEPHSHPITSALLYDWVDVSGFNNPDAKSVINRLKEAVKDANPGEWIAAFGYDPILIPELKALTADFLSEIAPENPIYVMTQTMHTSYANHLAFKLAGVTKDTPAPAPGSDYMKDEHGELTGMMVEAAASFPFMIAMSAQFLVDSEALMRRQFKRYADAGYTTVGALGIFPMLPDALNLLDRMIQEDSAPIRIPVYFKLEELQNGMQVEPGQGNDRYRYIGAKFWYDGSPYTGTMLLEEPYLESDMMQKNLGTPKHNRGYRMHDINDLKKHVQYYHDQGWQLSIHTQGDKAIKETLDIYEEVLKNSPRKDHRHRLEHCALFSDDQLKRAKDLGVCPSWHVNHIHYYGEALRDGIVGLERADAFMPIGSALKLGHINSLHNDSPMYPAEPLKLLRTAVTRKTRDGAVLGADEAISVAEGLKALTINAAWQMFMEDKVGSLEVGKLADLVILSQNPLTVDPDKLDQIEVLNTYRDGQSVR